MTNRSDDFQRLERGSRLGCLLKHFSLEASTFYAGELCHAYEFSSDKPGALLHIARGGRVVTNHDGHEQTHEPTSLLFYPRPYDHGYRPMADDPTEVICVRITFRGGDKSPFAASLPDVISLELDHHRSLAGTVDVMFTELESAGEAASASLNRLSEVLIIQLLRERLEEGDNLTGVLAGLADNKIGAALFAMHESPTKHWTVKDLAGLALMSRTSFSTEFGQIVGVPPMTYLSRLRVELAMQKLESNTTVSAVAQQVGFSSQSAFSRSFTKIVGLSPTAWRRRLETTSVG